MKYCVSICEFGAVAGGDVINTFSIQNAIDECFRRGGGEVFVPAGVFRTGGIRMRSGVYLHLLENAVLLGSRNPEDYFFYRADEVEPVDGKYISEAMWTAPGSSNRDYTFMRTPGSRWNNALIRFLFARDAGIIGEKNSYIDGADCYDEHGEEHYRGPHGISTWYCTNLVFRGYTFRNSANWAHAFFFTDNVMISKMAVHAGHDGIHMTGCRNIRITDCNFFTGDDCVAGIDNLNIYVSQCQLNSACSAFRFGGSNAFFEKCKIFGPCRYHFRGSLTIEEKRNGIASHSEGKRNNMLSAYTYYSDFSFPIRQQPGNIVISDCDIDFADRLLHYNFSGNETWQKNRPLESLILRHIRAKNIAMPLSVYGAKELPIHLEIVSSEISFRSDAENVPFIQANNYKRILLKDTVVKNNFANPFILTWQDEDAVVFDNFKCEGNPCAIEKTDRKFQCDTI